MMTLKNTGVKASIINSADGAKLVLTSTKSGSKAVINHISRDTVTESNTLTRTKDLKPGWLTASIPQKGVQAASAAEAGLLNIKIEPGDTLETLATKVNGYSASSGVQAFVKNGELFLKNTSTDKKIPLTYFTPGSTIGENKIKGQDAEVHIDGIKTTSASNTLEDVIQGVTIDLKKAKVDESFNVELKPDKDKMKKSIEKVVDSYNDVMKVIRRLTKATPGKKGERVNRPPLASDAMVNSLQNQLRSAFSKPVKGSSFGTLASIGIIAKRSGDLEVKDSVLDKALKKDPDAVVGMFIGKESALNSLMKVTESFIGPQDSSNEDDDDKKVPSHKKGLIKERLERLEKDKIGVDDEWKVANNRAQDIYESKLAELIAMDLAVKKMNNTIGMLKSMGA